MCVILLVAMFAASAPAGNGNSQAGGLPALERRVQKLEAQVAALISQAASIQFDVNELKSAVKILQNQLSALQNAVATLYNTVANLGTAVNDLKGQNNWAVVTSAGNVVRHSSNSNVTGTKPGAGTYDVAFTGTDVSKCAYVAAIRGATPGFITVTAGIFTGGTANEVRVQTFDKTGAPADSDFHLYVSCP
jgi:uncharacterized protein YoxC